MWRNRFSLIMVLVLVVTGLSACYKDAGENVQPTSNQVNLTDIAPPSPTMSVTLTSTPTVQSVDPTRTPIPTLVPTTTPRDGGAANQSITATTTSAPPQVQPATAPTTPPAVQPTDAPVMRPSFTPAIVESATPAGPVIETPGLSDIQPSATPPPTVDPANLPTPTPIPVEENPCVHLIQPNDTLYSIAQNNGVLLAELVAENAELLWAGADTPLQIGWQLSIPGCASDEPDAPTPGTLTPEPTGEAPAQVTPSPPALGEETIHVVSSGETIFSIGRLYDVDPYAIIEANNLVNPDFLQPGQELVIPAGSP